MEFVLYVGLVAGGPLRGAYLKVFAVYHPITHTFIMCGNWSSDIVQIAGRQCLHALTADIELARTDLDEKFGSKFFPVHRNGQPGVNNNTRRGLNILRCQALIWIPPAEQGIPVSPNPVRNNNNKDANIQNKDGNNAVTEAINP